MEIAPRISNIDEKVALANLSLPGHEFLLILSLVNWQGDDLRKKVMAEYGLHARIYWRLSIVLSRHWQVKKSGR